MEPESPRSKKPAKLPGKKNPSKLPSSRICINLSDCKYSVHRDVCKELGWRVIRNDEFNFFCDIIWNDAAVNQDILGTLKPFQKLNHFPGIFTIARKNFLAFHLKKMAKEFPTFYNFFPETFCVPADRSNLIRFAETCRPNQPFIVKPEASSQGKGIFLVRKIDDIPPGDPYVVQKYIDRPLLIDGLKFDLRVYFLITSVTPLTMYMYHEGLGRFATETYTAPSQKNLSQMCQHLTNYAINKGSSKFSVDKDPTKADSGHKRSLKSVWNSLEEMGHSSEVIIEQIKKIAIKTLCSIQPILSHIYNSCQPEDITGGMCFEVLGLDIIIDETGKPFLLEVNHAPSFNTDTPFDKQVKSQLLQDLFRLLDVTIERRNAIQAQYKQKLEERISQRTSKNTVGGNREADRKLYRSKILEHAAKNSGGFSLIYSGHENNCEPYDHFMSYAQKMHLIQTGVLSEKAEDKNRQSSKAPLVGGRPEKENKPVDNLLRKQLSICQAEQKLSTKEQKEKINHSVKRLSLPKQLSLPLKALFSSEPAQKVEKKEVKPCIVNIGMF